MLILLAGTVYVLWSEARWASQTQQVMRHRRKVRRGGGHTRVEEDD
jgi:hypothetical protein